MKLGADLRKHVLRNVMAWTLFLFFLPVTQAQTVSPVLAFSSSNGAAKSPLVQSRQHALQPKQAFKRNVAANGISPEQAIAQAQQVSPGRVLSVDKVQQGGKLVYRIKILGGNGRVSWVTIDAASGAVISK